MGRGEKCLPCNPGAELRLGGREKRREKLLINIIRRLLPTIKKYDSRGWYLIPGARYFASLAPAGGLSCRSLFSIVPPRRVPKSLSTTITAKLCGLGVLAWESPYSWGKTKAYVNIHKDSRTLLAFPVKKTEWKSSGNG